MTRAAILAVAVAVLVAGVAAAARDTGSPPPVTVVVFDALPIQLLVDDHGQIDAQRFPNFAALAGEGTWYRNATTVSESTRFSVPAILDGRQPRPRTTEFYADHPRNLFTLLAARGYRMNVSEEATGLCPVPLCPRRSRMTVIQRMRRGRVTRFLRGVSAVTRGTKPELTYIHTLLPHEPRQYLPDGHSYRFEGMPQALGGIPSENHRFLTEQLEQREILQLEYADHLLGELIARMKREGVWERSLLAVMSDHGESFAVASGRPRPFHIGELNFRRSATMQNLQDIAGIAMFVKYPHQREPHVDDGFVRSVDLLPTVLRATNTAPPPGLIGAALTDSHYTGHPTVDVYKQDGQLLTMPAARWLARVKRSKQHELALFGSGDRDLYDFGPAPELRGTTVDRLQLGPRTSMRAVPAAAEHFRNVRLRSAFLPALVYGRTAGGLPSNSTLLFALNGKVVATAPSFTPVTGVGFAALLPPDAFRDGVNELQIFESLGGLKARLLYSG